MAAGDLFKRAARYRKQHPGMSMPAAVKACAKKSKKKPAARKKAAPKKRAHKKAVGKVRKAAAGKTRKIKIKLKAGKKGGFNFGISGVSMDKIRQEMTHQHSLHSALEKHRAMLKTKGLRPAEKQQIRRDMAHYRNAISASRKHISALKRSI